MQVYVEDYPTIQEAINQAIANEMPLCFRPNKTYTVDQTLTLENGSLEIHGNGATLDSSASTINTITVKDSFLTLRAKDLSLKCIADGSQVSAMEIEARETQPINLYLDNFNVVGGEKGIRTRAGAIALGGDIFLRNCEFSGQYDNCLAIFSPPDKGRNVHLSNCYFHDAQTSHLVYCHPHNNVFCHNVRFGANGPNKYQFYLNGDNVNVQADYQLFSNCYFGPGGHRSLITDHASQNVIVDSCVLYNPIYYISSIKVRDCEFREDGIILFLEVMNVPNNKIIDIQGCTWREMNAGLNGPYINTRSFQGKTDCVYIKDCQFFAPDAPNTFNTMVAVGEDGQFIKIDDCEFHGGLCDRGLRAEDAATLLVTGCYFDGDYDVSCIFEDGNVNNFVKIDDCTFNHSLGQIYSGGSPDAGRNNYEMGVGYFNFVSDGDKLLLEQ